MAIAAFNSSVLVTSQPSISTSDEATSTSDNLTYAISTSAHRYLDPTATTTVQAEYDETQLITVTGSPTGGTFTLTFGANTTSTIAFDAAASVVQTDLQALSSIGSGNVLVTGSAGGPYTVQFTGTMAKTSEALITLGTNSLTGGTSPGVTITRVKAGGGFTTITPSVAGYTLYFCPGRITFAVAQPAGTVVRFHAASYFAISTLAEAAVAEFTPKMTMADVTVFSTTGHKSALPTLFEAQLKLTSFWLSIARSQSLLARDLLVVSFVLPGGSKYEGFVYASDMSMKFDPKNAITQDITFELTNEFFNA